MLYKLKFSTASTCEIDSMQTELKKTLLNKAACRSTLPLNLVWSGKGGMGMSRLSDVVGIERLRMLCHILSKRNSLARAIVIDAIDRLQSLTGSSNPVLTTAYKPELFRDHAHTWMSPQYQPSTAK